jgi:putative membrane protein insertion efficiency factor
MTWSVIARSLSHGLGLFLIGLIWGYRFFLAPLFPQVCRFQPTCSQYGIEAIQRRGPLVGAWLTTRRLLRCRPWGGRGFDPVPEANQRAAKHDSCMHAH